MNILITSNSAWNILHFRRAVVEALLADGHAVTVLAPLDDSVEALCRLGCRFMPLAMDVKGLNPFGAVALLLRLRAIFRGGGHDAILSYTIKNNLFGAIAARSCGIPFLPNVTGLGTAFLSGRGVQRVAEALYRGAFARLPVVFFQNADDRDLFVSRGLVREGQARLLPGSGIDLAHFAPAPEPAPDAPPVFLMIARLIRDKGVFEVAEAARRIKADRPEARFQLLGALAAENRTAIDRETVRGWVDAGIVEHLGTTEDVRPHIAAAHCVVLRSYREGAPRTLIEAAAMARPVITTDGHHHQVHRRFDPRSGRGDRRALRFDHHRRDLEGRKHPRGRGREGDREHPARPEHRAGQRACDHLRPHGHRYRGGAEGGRDQVGFSCRSAPAWWAAIASGSIPIP